MENLPIERFFGIGKVTSKKMITLGIMNGYDLKMKSLEFLKRILENKVHLFLILSEVYKTVLLIQIELENQ